MEKQNNRKINTFLKYPDEDIIEIKCSEGFKSIGCISKSDYDKVKYHYWSKETNGYVINWKTKIKLHNFLLNINESNSDKEVDHINRDKSNNTRSNLRIVNRQINNFNRGLNKNNSSGYKGVAWHSQRKKWRAFIMLDHKQISLGLYNDIEEVYKVRLEKENEIVLKLLENYNESK